MLEKYELEEMKTRREALHRFEAKLLELIAEAGRGDMWDGYRSIIVLMRQSVQTRIETIDRRLKREDRGVK